MTVRLQVKLIEGEEDMQAARDIRVRVFVKEQECPPEEEFDDLDAVSSHALALFKGRPAGTGRVYFESPETAHVGRMAVEASCRKRGVGRAILALLESHARSLGAREVALHAQMQAQGFYEKSGYTAQGDTFFEVDIAHILMVKRLD